MTGRRSCHTGSRQGSLRSGPRQGCGPTHRPRDRLRYAVIDHQYPAAGSLSRSSKLPEAAGCSVRPGASPNGRCGPRSEVRPGRGGPSIFGLGLTRRKSRSVLVSSRAWELTAACSGSRRRVDRQSVMSSIARRRTQVAGRTHSASPRQDVRGSCTATLRLVSHGPNSGILTR